MIAEGAAPQSAAASVSRRDEAAAPLMRAAPSIYDYESFGAFFGAHVVWQKQSHPGYSFRTLAKRLGGASSSLLAMIARDERRPQSDLLLKIAQHLSMSREEVDYAEALLGFQKARTTAARARFAERLRQLRPICDEVLLSLDVFELISRWHHLTILEMTRLPRFREDPERIARHLGLSVTPDMVRESLTLLERLGMVRRDAEGKPCKVAHRYRTPRNLASSSSRSYHKQMMQRAHQALDRQSVSERYITSLTIPVSVAKLPQASARISAFRDAFAAEFGGDSGDEVYHLNVQLFRATVESAFPPS